MELVYDSKYDLHNDVDNIIVSNASLGDLECIYDKNIIAGDYIMPPKKEMKEKKASAGKEKKEKKDSKEKKPRAKKISKPSAAKMNGTGKVAVQDPSN
tara:strand:+ start:1649 stop:1942 length:294 start_codon:yes stop_codon:yes gene_type:complete